MDFNASSFYENDENELNSTAFDQGPNSTVSHLKKDWTISPIRSNNRKCNDTSSKLFKSPLRIKEESGYSSRNTENSDCSLRITENSTSSVQNKTSYESPGCSKTADNTSKGSELNVSSWIASRSKNPFDSIQYEDLHKSLHFSPNFMLSSDSPEKDGKFQWSIEQLSMLKPVHFTEQELSIVHSPDPVVESMMHEKIQEYWSKNMPVIPSPDGPRHLQLRGAEKDTNGSPSSQISVKMFSEKLCNLVRKNEAHKVAYATSSPIQRPRKKLRRMRNIKTQTEVTIPSNSELDLKKLLGPEFVYEDNSREEVDEFDESMRSNVSFARRLFQAEDDDSFVSCEQLDESSADISKVFNDDLSPVRKVERDNEEDEIEESVVDVDTNQLSLNINIMNECMVVSMQAAKEDVSMCSMQDSQIMPDVSMMSEKPRAPSPIIEEGEFEVNFESPSHFRADLGWTPKKKKLMTLETFDMSPIVNQATPMKKP